MQSLAHIINVSRMAAERNNVGVLSTGEALAAAVVLNRADWLAEMGYTITEALARIGDDWVAQLNAASQALSEDAQMARVVAEGVAKAKVRPAPANGSDEPTVLDYEATLVTYGSAPGYRDVDLTVDLRELDGSPDGHRLRASIRFNAEDSANVAQHIQRVHSFAWSTERGPLDKKDAEQRPGWAK